MRRRVKPKSEIEPSANVTFKDNEEKGEGKEKKPLIPILDVELLGMQRRVIQKFKAEHEPNRRFEDEEKREKQKTRK